MKFHTIEAEYEYHIKHVLKGLYALYVERTDGWGFNDGDNQTFEDWLESREATSLVRDAFLGDFFDWLGGDDIETLLED